MFEFIPASDQLVKERAASAANAAKNTKLSADLDFVAMMCGVDLDEGETISEEVVDNG
jgi:hypothetical protein